MTSEQAKAIASIQTTIVDPSNAALTAALARPPIGDAADEPYSVWVARQDGATDAMWVRPSDRNPDHIWIVQRPMTRASISVYLIYDRLTHRWVFADGDASKLWYVSASEILAAANSAIGA